MSKEETQPHQEKRVVETGELSRKDGRGEAGAVPLTPLVPEYVVPPEVEKPVTTTDQPTPPETTPAKED